MPVRPFPATLVVLAMVGSVRAAELSVVSMAMPPDTTVALVVSGDVTGEDTYGVTVMVELVTRTGNTGTLAFTMEPPVDIVQLGDPWPDGGTFTPFDTGLTGSVSLNGSVDDNGTFIPAPVTYSGELSGLPVISSAGAEGVWDVVLSTSVGESSWEGLATTLVSGTITVTAGACVTDEDCADGAACTADTCPAGICDYEDLCEDDGLFCNGVEFCNLETGVCDHSGDPCPGFCDEENDICDVSCEPPTVQAVGSRYLAITPQPPTGPDLPAVSFLVSSPDWPCLSKYVGGFPQCGETGSRCFTDADCNHCDGVYGGPCLSDTDCKTCTASHSPCQTNDDCNPGDTCVQEEHCVVTGEVCAPHLPLETVDVNGDGLADGLIATLVDDPANAVSLAPEEWGTLVYRRCSVSFAVCAVDGDCDVGVCSISATPCSRSVQDCRNVCTESGYECDNDEQCIGGPSDVCTVPQTCESYETCAPGRIYLTGKDILPSEAGGIMTTYQVQGDCGPVTDPVSAVMRQWCDADDNAVVNMADVQAVVLAFKRDFGIFIPPRTLVGVDLVGAAPCLPDQGISFDDIQQTVLAFKGARYNPDVLAGSDVCTVPCP